jgi:glycosyltransferase involved in cell wall biosynthesis
MALGTPVIASNCTSIPEVLGDVGLKFDPDDHAAIAKGIEQMINNKVLWRQQSISGIARSKLFNWMESAALHLKVYETVLEEFHGPIV